jgi:adenylyltransferase/sulfurtransferase
LPLPVWARSVIVDFDVVDASNLQRQIIHGTKDIGRAKIASARIV